MSGIHLLVRAVLCMYAKSIRGTLQGTDVGYLIICVLETVKPVTRVQPTDYWEVTVYFLSTTLSLSKFCNIIISRVAALAIILSVCLSVCW